MFPRRWRPNRGWQAGRPLLQGGVQILGCPMRAFWPRAARTWAVARRPAEQSNCASLWQLFKACNDTAVLQFLLARGRAAQFFRPYRLAAAQGHSTPAQQQQLRLTTAAHGRFSTALLFGPKPVLTAPVISAETATNQQQSPQSTPWRRPQPLRDVRARGQHRAATKPPKPPRGPRRKVAPDLRLPKQHRRRGFNEIPTSQSAQLLDRVG